MSPQENDRLVDRFFAAIERGDRAALERIYTDDAAIWHNFTGVAQDKWTNIARLERARALAAIRYEVIERIPLGNRIIQRHNVHFIGADGTKGVLHAALFITVRDGQIARLDEYLDPAQSVLARPEAREAGR